MGLCVLTIIIPIKAISLLSMFRKKNFPISPQYSRLWLLNCSGTDKWAGGRSRRKEKEPAVETEKERVVILGSVYFFLE